MRATLTAIAASAVLLLAATSAAAQPARTDWVPIWKAAAITYWTARGDHALNADGNACTDIVIAWGAVGDGDWGMNDALCHITLDVTVWHANPDPRDRCIVIAHEIGHVFGEGHTRTGIMAPDLDDTPVWTRVPPCAASMRRHRSRSGWTMTPA